LKINALINWKNQPRSGTKAGDLKWHMQLNSASQLEMSDNEIST